MDESWMIAWLHAYIENKLLYNIGNIMRLFRNGFRILKIIEFGWGGTHSIGPKSDPKFEFHR